MTKLVLVHGINNEENSADIILDTWIDSIRAATGKDSVWAREVRRKAVAPFYGKILADGQSTSKSGIITQGGSSLEPIFQTIIDQALVDIQSGKTPSEIVEKWEENNEPIAAGNGVNKVWVKATARLIEKLSPFHGMLALRLLSQAHTYLTRPSIAQTVDEIVESAMKGDDEPLVVVSHSLGSVVSYKLLRKFSSIGKPRSCSLFVTLGSPLTIDVFRQTFSKPRNRPADVVRWINGADPEDFVAFRDGITIDNFGPGVDKNILNINNGADNPHLVTDYLSNKEVSKEIVACL